MRLPMSSVVCVLKSLQLCACASKEVTRRVGVHVCLLKGLCVLMFTTLVCMFDLVGTVD